MTGQGRTPSSEPCPRCYPDRPDARLRYLCERHCGHGAVRPIGDGWACERCGAAFAPATAPARVSSAEGGADRA